MRHEKKIQIVKKIFFLISLILYFAFMMLDLLKNANDLSNYLKYSSIAFCTIYVLISTKYTECKRATGLLLVAFLFTFIADYYLLLIAKEVPGLISFCVVQFFYFILISTYYGGFIKSLFLRILLCSLIILLEMIGKTNSTIVMISSIYFTNFICNLIQTIWSFRQKKQTPILLFHFFIGLLLFFFCDICVGIYNMDQFIQLPDSISWLQEAAGYGMWGFYLPGQVLLATSIKYRRRNQFI